MKKMLPPLTLILGGASSGKSAFAENLVTGTRRPRHYVATAQAFDDEMKAKIAAHRETRGADWITHDAPLNVGAALVTAEATDVVLLDCATMWLSNHLLAESDLEAASDAFLSAVEACAAPVVVVSNEVGHGVVPEYKLGRRFRDAQGRLNQALAARAELCVFVTAGLPMVLKGTLP